MRRNSEGDRVALVLAIMFVLTGCKGKPLRVNLAPGYKGAVTIVCGSYSDDSQTITVDATGRVENAPCSLHRTELLIMRDGKTISAEGEIKWDSTGDGIPVSIQFTIG
jgi:hypothetical protein